jgi:hypothetical protein
MKMGRMLKLLLLCGLVALAAVAAGSAAAPPVGALPKGPVLKVDAPKGALVAVALPRRAGFSWRLARQVNPSVLRQVSEADVGKSVLVVFRATGRGDATIAFGLTRGETPRAYASLTQKVHVS